MLTPSDKVRLQLEQQIAQDAIARAKKRNLDDSAILPTFMGADGKIKRLGQGESRGNQAPNLYYATGEEMRSIPVRGGISMVDNKSILKPLAPITDFIKLLLQKDQDIYISGDRSPEKIFTLGGSSSLIGANRIKNTGGNKGDYIANFVSTDGSGYYTFHSIKNKNATSKTVDLSWTFSATAFDQDDIPFTNDFVGSPSYIFFENDFALIILTAEYRLENRDPSDILIGFRNSIVYAKTAFVDMKTNAYTVVTATTSGLTLPDNGTASISDTDIEIPLSPSKNVTGRIAIFCEDYGSGFELGFGTNDRLFSTSIDLQSKLMHSYNTSQGRLYSGAGLPLVHSYDYSSLLPTAPNINLINASNFTQIIDLVGDKARTYKGTLGGTITYGDLVSVPFKGNLEGYTVLDKSAFFP